MKIKANNANSPIWKDRSSLSQASTTVGNHLMRSLRIFGGYGIMKALNYLARSTNNFGNPQKVTLYSYCKAFHTNVWKEILADKELMAEIQKVYADFKAYINVKPDKTQPSVAYFQHGVRFDQMY